MASAAQIKALIQSHIERDDIRFFSVAMQIAASEAKSGHGKLATEIRDIIDKGKKRGIFAAKEKGVNIAPPRGDLADLFAVFKPKMRISDMVLSDKLKSHLTRIIEEQKYFDKLTTRGLSPRSRLLLTGQPGCGKTMTASVLAGELGIPLFIVRLEGLITKYMGETTSKLRLIFNAIEENRAVYLFDEFDSIGSKRDFVNDVGEIRRVLNSFLMFIENHNSHGLLIAATNHQQNLDFALFRRFDDVIEYVLPDDRLVIKTFEMRLSGYANSRVDYKMLAGDAQGMSFADITKACEEAVKDMIIHDRSSLTTQDVQKAVAERKNITGSIPKKKS